MKFGVNEREANDSLRRVGKALQTAMVDSLKQVVDVAVSDAKATTLFKDGTGRGGRLRNKTRRAVVSAEHIQLRNDSPHAKFIEGGTSPHRIFPQGGFSSRRFLRFKVAGSWVFARSVMHPGTAARPFMAEAAAYAESVAPFIFAENIEKAVSLG